MPSSKINISFSYSVAGIFKVTFCLAEVSFNCCAELFCRRFKVARLSACNVKVVQASKVFLFHLYHPPILAVHRLLGS